MAELVHVLSIEAPIERVFKVLHSQGNLWWTEDMTGDPEEGGTLDFRWPTDQGYRHRMKVDKLIPNHRLEWFCLDHDPEPEWSGTKLIFDTWEENNKTRLRLTHIWREETDYMAGCNYFWAFTLCNIKKVSEEAA